MNTVDKLTLSLAKKALAADTERKYHHPTEELMWQSPHAEDVWYSAHAPDPTQPDWDTLRVFAPE